MVEVFREARRVLRGDGTLWLNLGDAYGATTRGAGGAGDGRQQRNKGSELEDRRWRVPCGLKPKDLLGIPWRAAFALQADGWWLRSDIIWHKPNPMPESVTDRPTKSHEYLFLLAKAERYFYRSDLVKEIATYAPGNARTFRRSGGYIWDRSFENSNVTAAINGHERNSTGKRNRRTVWKIATQSFKGAHFATFPEKLVQPCIKAGSRPGDTILDPFSGAGTTGVVALKLGRNYVGIELNAEYVRMSRDRLAAVAPLLAEEAAA
jgi:DNA modification methylase